MTLDAPIYRPSLHEELVDRIRAMIVEDRFQPGEKIPEKSLCDSFGVSRTPLREALKVLASEGLVVLTPNRGARVATVTVEELEQTFPVLAALERLVGEAAAELMTDNDVAHVRDRHAAMVRHHAERDRSAYFTANQDIHAALLKSAGNPVLEQHHTKLASRVRRARFMANISDDRWAEAIAEHVQILDALEARDGARLGALLSGHLLNKHIALRRALEGPPREAAE